MPLTNPLFATYGRTPENNKRIFSSMRPQTSFEMSRMSGSSPQMASHSKRVVPWEVPTTHNPKGMTHDWRLSTEQRRASNLAKNNARSRRTAIAVGTRCSGASCPERTGCASSTSGTRAGASGVDTGRSMDADGSSSDDCRREVLICMSGGFLFNRTSISWIWVDIRAQLVGGDLPADGFGNRDHHFGGRDFRLDAVQPAPDMHLADLGLRQPGPDTPRQRRLASGEFNGFLKGLA